MKKELRNIRLILPILHIVASFLYERCILIFRADIDVVAAIPLNNAISDRAEQIIAYAVAKLFAMLAVFALWKLVFYVKDHWKTDGGVRLFVLLFAAGGLLLSLQWPDGFLRSEDNLITYSYAIRLWPEYWHSAYSSIVYCACLMVLPHPFSVSLLQWLAAVLVIAYLYERIRTSPVLKGRGKWLAFGILLIPDSYYLLTDAYRTSHYALLSAFFVTLAVMDIIDRRERSGRELAGMVLLCGFLSVWRTEGIVLGILGFGVLIAFGYRYSLKKCLLLLAGVAAAFLVINLPQKLGSEKYYGNDYSFINSFPTLQNVLNAPSANLGYEGATEDLTALGQVTPVEVIQAYGMEGYRRQNVRNGYRDINQSGADAETGAAYKKAYYRMILHNLPIYVRTQGSMLLQAIRLKEYCYIEKSAVSVTMEPWHYDAWDIGREDLFAAPGVKAWYELPLRRTLAEGWRTARTAVSDFLRRAYLQSLILILAGLLEAVLFCRETILFFRKKSACLGMAGMAFVLLGQAAAIVLVMPAGVLAYFHAYFYCTAVLDILYLLYLRSSKTKQVFPDGERKD